MMSCETSQRLIASLGVGDEPPPAVADHVASCGACAAVLVEERHVRTALAGAPWPMSARVGDLGRLTAYAVAKEEERRLRHQRVTRRWASGLGLLAVAGAIGAWAAWPQRFGGASGGGSLRSALLIGLGVAGFAWLDIAGRRMAAAGAATSAQLGLSLGRAAIGLALVVAVVEPSRWAELPYLVARVSGGPAAAQGGVVEGQLLCAAGADGRLRLARASEGCRGSEVAVELGGRAGGDAATAVGAAGTTLDRVAIRFGTAVIPAGQSAVRVEFGPPMRDAGYHVLFSPHTPSKPMTVDDSCHLLGAGAASIGSFVIEIRRCWFEGIDRPPDRVASDVAVDWVVIGER